MIVEVGGVWMVGKGGIGEGDWVLCVRWLKVVVLRVGEVVVCDFEKEECLE